MTGPGCRSCSSPPRAHVQADLSRGGFLRVLAPRKAQQLRVASGGVAELGNRGACLQQFEIPQGRDPVSTPPPSVQGGSMPRETLQQGWPRRRGGACCSPGESPCRCRRCSPPSGCSLLCSLPGLSQNQHRRTPSPAMVPGSTRRKSVSQARPSSPSLPWRRTRGLGAQIGTSWRAGAT